MKKHFAITSASLLAILSVNAQAENKPLTQPETINVQEEKNREKIVIKKSQFELAKDWIYKDLHNGTEKDINLQQIVDGEKIVINDVLPYSALKKSEVIFFDDDSAVSLNYIFVQNLRDKMYGKGATYVFFDKEEVEGNPITNITVVLDTYNIYEPTLVEEIEDKFQTYFEHHEKFKASDRREFRREVQKLVKESNISKNFKYLD